MAAAPIADVAFGLNTILWEGLKAENVLADILTRYTDPNGDLGVSGQLLNGFSLIFKFA